MKNYMKEVVQYCATNIEDWGDKVALALDHIGRRMPIDYGFRNEIEDAVEDWCDENGVSVDFFEWDDVVNDIVLWKDDE